MRREKCLKCERLRREREFIESLPASKQLVLVAASWGLGMLALGRASGGHSWGGGNVERSQRLGIRQMLNGRGRRMGVIDSERGGITLKIKKRPHTLNLCLLKTVNVNCYDLFRLCPQLSGCILFAPQDARAIFLLRDLSCNDTCSVVRGTYCGVTNGKYPIADIKSRKNNGLFQARKSEILTQKKISKS